MPDEGRGLGWKRGAGVVGLVALTVSVNLGGAGRLTYHEAFVAQAAREMIASGDWLVPTVGGQPWLEKPPLPIWLVAGLSWAAGGVTEWAARVPSALAAVGVALGVASLAARRFGPTVGLLAGLIQATTAWTVLRGRLGEADILLAALVTGLILAFDRLRSPEPGPAWDHPPTIRGPHQSRVRQLVAVVAGRSPVAVTSPLPCPATRTGPPVPDSSAGRAGGGRSGVCSGRRRWSRGSASARRWRSRRSGRSCSGIATAGRSAGSRASGGHWSRWSSRWPGRWRRWSERPAAWSLWTMHVADRLAATPSTSSAGRGGHYLPAVLLQALPVDAAGAPGGGAVARAGLARAGRGRSPPLGLGGGPGPGPLGGDGQERPLRDPRPPPLVDLGRPGPGPGRADRPPPRLVVAGAGPPPRGRPVRRAGPGGGAGLPRRRPPARRPGREWAYCESIGRTLDPATPLVCLYEDWDRKPYPTPFGPVPHDWAIRLFSFGRPATWRQGIDDLVARPPTPPANRSPSSAATATAPRWAAWAGWR